MACVVVLAATFAFVCDTEGQALVCAYVLLVASRQTLQVISYDLDTI